MLEDFKLKVFSTVCRTHNFTKAARALEITQPAVSQNVAELEKLLGVSLFDRGRGEVTLTPDGEEFARYAERILYWCHQAEEKFIGPQTIPYADDRDAVSAHETTALLPLGEGATAEVYVRDGALQINFKK